MAAGNALPYDKRVSFIRSKTSRITIVVGSSADPLGSYSIRLNIPKLTSETWFYPLLCQQSATNRLLFEISCFNTGVIFEEFFNAYAFSNHTGHGAYSRVTTGDRFYTYHVSNNSYYISDGIRTASNSLNSSGIVTSAVNIRIENYAWYGGMIMTDRSGVKYHEIFPVIKNGVAGLFDSVNGVLYLDENLEYTD